MWLDSYGLPTQKDGDKADQLQRVGMIATAYELLNTNGLPECTLQTCTAALAGPLQPKLGVYVRSVGNNPNNVSADQLISALAAHIAVGSTKQSLLMLLRCLARLGFAQNYKDGLNADTKTKLPDFMLLRALPLFARISWLTYPLALVSDLYLVGAALASWFDKNPDHVDDNVLILTLAVCARRKPTPLSKLACWLYGKLRPVNNGNLILGESNKVQGALSWYHRAETGANPEIAELWKPLCKELFE